MGFGIYFETWATQWTANSVDMDLAKIDANIVYLAFCKPDCNYSKRYSFDGTGLQFSQDFKVVVGAIDILKKKGTKVMLSVGGGAYSDWSNVQYTNIKLLMIDLHCDGVDIDWEPQHTAKAKITLEQQLTLANRWTEIIETFYSYLGDTHNLSAAVWSTGAYGPTAGDVYKGINIPGLVNAGEQLDWLNIMAYDAGKDFDALGAYDCYRIYYKGPLYVGFELGKQGWGDAILSLEHIDKVMSYLKGNDGVFVWGYGSMVATGYGPTYTQTVARIKTHLKGTSKPVPLPIYVTPANPPKVVSSINAFNCPNCQIVLKVSK